MLNGIDLDFLKNTRRNAFVKAFEQKIEKDNVIGYFGKVPEEIFYACSLVAFPLEGIDSYIFEFGKEENMCDVMKSTLIYQNTDKCPILFACNMYVFSDLCQKFYSEFKKRSEKEVYKFKNENELIKKIEIVYGVEFSLEKYNLAKEKLTYINELLEKIDKCSNVTTEQAFLLRYYTQYLQIDERYDYFKSLEEKYSFNEKEKDIQKVYIICPRGGYNEALKDINLDNKEVVRLYFGEENLTYGYEYCPYNSKIIINYGG